MLEGRKLKERLFLLVCAITIGVASLSLNEKEPPAGHVHMKDSRFFLDGEPFYPMVMNYIVAFQSDGSELWPAAYPGYTKGYRYPYRNRDSCLMQIDADLKLIKELGFNAVRIVKLAEGPLKDRTTGALFLKAFSTAATDTLIALDNEHTYASFLQGVEDVAQIAERNGMKIILLTNLRPNDEQLEQYWRKVAQRMRSRSSIMAFDLFNEPLYFDSLERSKKEVHEIVKGWRRLMDEELPDHLFTIGLQGIRETFEWDPNILDVDFISFHPYEYETEQVRNELRWYHENVDVPWIVGETSLPADNDSVPYSEQETFARKVLQQTYNCGGCGFSWWQYKDVEWGEFHSDRMGLLSLEGSTPVHNAAIQVSGSPKPAAIAFREFDPRGSRGECALLPNYFNYSQHTTSMLSGRLTDMEGKPIEGGVVIAWNEFWSSSYHTVSGADGSFQLRGDFYFHHWMATATRYNWVRGDCNPNSFLTGSANIPEYSLGDLRLEPIGL